MSLWVPSLILTPGLGTLNTTGKAWGLPVPGTGRENQPSVILLVKDSTWDISSFPKRKSGWRGLKVTKSGELSWGSGEAFPPQHTPYGWEQPCGFLLEVNWPRWCGCSLVEEGLGIHGWASEELCRGNRIFLAPIKGLIVFSKYNMVIVDIMVISW